MAALRSSSKDEWP